MKGKIKKITTIVITAIIFLTMGVALPIVVKGENGDANAAQVLAGKTFTSSLVSVATSGEMKNLSGKTFATNNPGVSTINVDDGYYTEIQVDASEVYQAGYDAGVAVGETSSSSSFPSIYNSSNNEVVKITAPSLSCQVNGTSTTSGVYTVQSKMTCSLTLTASGVTSYSNSASMYLNGTAIKSVTSAEGSPSNSTSFTYTFAPGDQIYVRAYRTGSNQNIVATLTFNSIVAAD